MIPVFQTHDKNCVQAALASILELPLESVPDISKIEGEAGPWAAWWLELSSFVRRLGFAYIEMRLPAEVPWMPIPWPITCIMMGYTKKGIRHAVVGRVGEQFEILHDPFPGGSSIENIDALGLLVPLHPWAAGNPIINVPFAQSANHKQIITS